MTTPYDPTLASHDMGFHSAGFGPDGRVIAVSLIGKPFMTCAWSVDFQVAAPARCPRELTPAERTCFELAAH